MAPRIDSGLPVAGEPRALTAGEVWVRDQLERLLAARLAPRATARFLAASGRRAATNRAARPELARRAYIWLALGALGWLALAGAGVQPYRRRLRAGLGWWATTALMLDWHLGMVETDDGRPRQLGVADALTLVRAWLVPVVADSPTALACGLGAVTDLLDGRLARRTEPTRAGRDLEGLVDACFALAALHGLARAGLLGPLPARAESARLVAGVGYATFVYLGRARAPEARLVRAARSTAAVRFVGILAAAAGHRRLGGALLSSGSACSVALNALAARR